MPIITLYPQDTYLSYDNPTTVYGTDNYLKVGNNTPTSGYFRTLLQFDFSLIPAGAYISSAQLNLYNTGTGLPDILPVAVYALLKNWDNAFACWNNRTSSGAWASGGAGAADNDYRNFAYYVYPIASAGWANLEIRDIVQDWIWGSVTNNGLILSQYTTTYNNNTKVFYSNDYTSPLLRPNLYITYYIPPTTPIIDVTPTYTKGLSNTISWSASAGAIEYFPILATDNGFNYNVVTLENVARQENVESTSTLTLDVAYGVKDVIGVWLTSAKTGINYYYDNSITPLPGTFDKETITLGQALPSANTAVYVEYIGSGWTPRIQNTFSGLLDGQLYFYRVKARDVVNAESQWSAYVYSTQDNKIDSLKLILPNGLEVWNGRTTKFITWEAKDNISGLQNITEIYRSGDSGATWVLLDDGLLNETNLVNEATTSVTTTRVYTKYTIRNVVGVWLASDTLKTGTNYYLVGASTPLPTPFDRREIVLGTALPADATDVIIDYQTYGLYQWNIPDNVDSLNTRIKVKVTDNAGNVEEVISDKDFVVITILNRLHKIYNTSDDSYITKIIKSFKSELEIINRNTDEFRILVNISTAESGDLDKHGESIFVYRRPGEADIDYRVRIINAMVSPKNTKQSIINAVAPYCIVPPIIIEWSGSTSIFYLDWSFLDYTSYLSGGSGYGEDPFTFEIWVQPKDNSFNTFLGIVNAIETTKPAGTLYYIKIPIPGAYYGTSLYATFYYTSSL